MAKRIVKTPVAKEAVAAGAVAAVGALDEATKTNPVAAAQENIRKHARRIFDFVKERGAVSFSEMLSVIPDAPSLAADAAIEYLEDKSLLHYDSKTEKYSIEFGAEWFTTATAPKIVVEAKRIFDYLEARGTAGFNALYGLSSLSLEDFHAAQRLLEEKELIFFSEKKQVYSLAPSAKWTKAFPPETATPVAEKPAAYSGTFDLPPIDLERYEKAAQIEGWELDEEFSSTPEETRDDYFTQAIGMAEKIRQTEASLSSFNEKTQKGAKEKKNAEQFIEHNTASMGAYLVESERFFGIESAKYLEKQLNEFGFYFDENFKTKAAVKTVQTVEAKGEVKPVSTSERFDLVSVEQLVPSPTVPQGERRKRLNDPKLDELAESIRQEGIIEPLIVRPNGSPGKFEIVCGERRWLASQKAGLEKVLCIVRDLTDEQVLKIQLDENLHRQDVHPLDEAVWYEHLQQSLGHDQEELALRFGKTKKYIAGRLKLNNLIEEAKAKLATDELPVGHAIEIAKFEPQTQAEVFKKCWDYSGNLVPRDKLVKTVGNEVLLNLKNAKFSIEATDLREDGLPCNLCPQRTGARGFLFEEYFNKKEDRCLNRSCYDTKLKNHLLQVRAQITEAAIAAGKPADYNAPLYVYWSGELERYEKLYGEKLLTSHQDFRNVYGEDCPCVEIALCVSGYSVGEQTRICRDENCPQHGTKKQEETAAERKLREARQKAEREQKEFDVKIANIVRENVFKLVVENFGAENWIYNRKNWNKFIAFHLFNELGYDSKDLVLSLAEIKNSELPSVRDSLETAFQKLDKIPVEKLSKLMFLSLVGEFGENRYGSLEDQSKVAALAEEFNIDYRLLDARARYEKAPKKSKQIASDYLNKVESGDKKAKKPNFFIVGKPKETEAAQS